MIERYTSARELFEATRDASKERERTRRQLESLDARRSGCGSSVAGGGRGGRRDVNGMGPTIAFIDYEERMRQRIADDERLIDYACSVVYGTDGTGGVNDLMGTVHADALFWRFIAAETWTRCAEACGVGESSVRRLVQEGLDLVDALGSDRVAAGMGIAEE